MTVGSPKVVPTTAFGRRFRSTTEARWATCLTEFGLPWEYETETYDLGPLGWYLPDFWLPSFEASDESPGVFLEVKPDLMLADQDYDKAARLRVLTGRPVLVALGFGIPPFDDLRRPDEYALRHDHFRGELYDVLTFKTGVGLPTAGGGGRGHYFVSGRQHGWVDVSVAGMGCRAVIGPTDWTRTRRAYEAGTSFRPDGR